MYESEQGQELDSQSGANDQASPEPASNEGSNEDTKVSSQQKTDETANLRLNDHPRFKEVIEQKNQAIAAQKALEERYAQLEAQIKQQLSQPKAQTQAEKDELIEHLKTINPAFAARFEQLSKALPTVESMQKKIEAYEREQVRTQAVNTINQLHESNKASPELRNFINSQLDLMAMKGELQGLNDVPAAYQKVYGEYKKFIESIERSTRESYVAGKKSDAATPTSQPKGKPVSTAPQKPSFSKDPEVARQQIVSRYLKQAKAEADL